MRVLHVFDHSLPLHSGYSFRSRALMLGQRALGWETCHLTTPRHSRPGPDPETADGLTFHRTPPATGWMTGVPVLREWAEINATATRLEALARSVRPDLIHAHSPALNGMAGLRVARALGVPLVYEVRATWEDAAVANLMSREGSARYRATRALEQHVVRHADAVGVICQGLYQEFLARGVPADRLFVVPNAVDVEQFTFAQPRDTALAAELGLDDAEVVGFLGSFYDYEGLDVLVDAFARLAPRRPRLRLLLVGGGPQEASLRAQIASLGLTSRVIAPGRVPHDMVDRYYSLVDILAYPRKRTRVTELVTPLKPLEAMALGKLLVASDVGGHRELIRDGETGVLFPADDADALSAALARLFDQPERWPAFQAAGRHYVTTERTWARSVAAYPPVYARLTGTVTTAAAVGLSPAA